MGANAGKGFSGVQGYNSAKMIQVSFETREVVRELAHSLRCVMSSWRWEDAEQASSRLLMEARSIKCAVGNKCGLLGG